MNTVDEIVKSLGNKKGQFLSSVETSIDSYISNKSWQDCLTIVLRNSNGDVSSKWHPSEIKNGYTPRFIAFLRKKPYNGYIVDSALTDGVVEIVTNKFSLFYKENTSAISNALLDQMLKNHVFIEQLSSQVIEISNGSLPSAIKSQMTAAIIHHLEKAMNINIAESCSHVIVASTGQIVALSASIPITKAMIAAMGKSIAFFMKTAIAKVLASTAMKTMMMTAVKKIVAAKIVATIIALVGTHLSGISVAWVIIPLLLAFFAYEVSHLPQKMGKKVSEAVKKELNGEFEKINKTITMQIVGSLSSSVINVIANDIAKNEEIKEMLRSWVKS